MIAQELWQAYNQIFYIIWSKEFIKLNANIDMIMKTFNHVELNTKTANAVLNTKT